MFNVQQTKGLLRNIGQCLQEAHILIFQQHLVEFSLWTTQWLQA